MLRIVVSLCLTVGILAAPGAGADRTVLMPGVTYERQVQFTRHGPVVLHVVNAPKPGGQYDLRPVISNNVVPGLERLTAMERRVGSSAGVVGLSGDASLLGAYVQGGVLSSLPNPERATLAIDAGGNLRVERMSVFATWEGNGPRRPGLLLNRSPGPNGASLFTPAWGAATPASANTVEAVLSAFPAASANVGLSGTVVDIRQGGARPIPADGAVLVARGTQAGRLAAEAPLGSAVTVRLLSSALTGVLHAVGGGPLLVRSGRPVYRSGEEFSTSELALWQPRSAVGQRADGRLLLVAIDGRQPGYSTGVTNFELGQAMARLGAVTAGGLTVGSATTMAHDGKLLSRPAGGERAVADALLVWYAGQKRPPGKGNR